MKKFIITKSLNKNLNGFEDEKFYQFINKSNVQNEDVTKIVLEIIDDVKENGDEALIKYANKFDKTTFQKAKDLIISEKEINDSEKKVNKEVKQALELAYRRIFKYHKNQLPKDFNYQDNCGIELGNIWRNIEKIGVYVPGGTASYPSSVLMSAVPAIVAGVRDIIVCAPTSGGEINQAVLYACKLCKIKKIYKIGGAGAISAMTYGTKTVEKVNKIVGPGNSFVATAKKILFGEVGIDMIAGPTDITIIADKSSKASWIASDALSQLEHGEDSKAFIITDNENLADEIAKNITELSKSLLRKKIIEKSILNSAFFIVKNLEKDSIFLANFIAPEHLEIATNNAKSYLPKIQNAGAIFLGNYAPESLGDYIAGPSHTLPTMASAKFSSGLSVFDFMKRISVISATKESFKKLAKQTEILAECEGLDAHKLSIEIRGKNVKF